MFPIDCCPCIIVIHVVDSSCFRVLLSYCSFCNYLQIPTWISNSESDNIVLKPHKTQFPHKSPPLISNLLISSSPTAAILVNVHALTLRTKLTPWTAENATATIFNWSEPQCMQKNASSKKSITSNTGSEMAIRLRYDSHGPTANDKPHPLSGVSCHHQSDFEIQVAE